MSNKKLTEIEITNLINRKTNEHIKLKEDIITLTNEMDNIQNLINNKLKKLESIEKDYVGLIEELNNS